VVCLLFLLLLSLVGCSSPASPRPPDAGLVSPDGGEVRLWQDAAIFTLVGRLIDTARERVLVEVYELGRPDLVDALSAARARGVSVRVITDPTVEASRRSVERLKSAGVPVRPYPVDDRRHQIDHVKMLVADGEAAVGGMNWGAHSDRNHDYVLETRVAAHLERLLLIFEQDWSLASGHPAPLHQLASAVGQTSPGDEIRKMLEAAFATARRHILAEIYTLTDPRTVVELVRAHRRGLDVRIVLDPNQAYNLRSGHMLGAAGVDVRWYPVPPGVLLHAKVGLFDATLIVGSANWTLSGLGVNHELDIETDDAQAVAAYGSRFEADWDRSAA
jgi:phosphatidylserine/phosphatidylglycerophosphate/cardiolipin synthase-like enzyme